MTTRQETLVAVDGRTLRLTNLDKVLWPAAGFTKGQMLDYYARVAPWVVPHLRGRPLTMRRFPEGVDGITWYQTACRGAPPWVRHNPVPSVMIEGKIIDYCVVDDMATLLWIANLGTIEFHPLLACGDDVQQPSFVVFDLDPGAPAGLRECCEVALLVRDMLAAVGLVAHAKVSGGKGLQLYVPLRPGHTYAQTKPFARTIAEVLAAERPELVVDRMDKRLRPGRVLVDWSQNDPTKSTIVVYSLRAQPAPTVSMPVTWDDVAKGATEPEADRRLRVSPAEALDRLERAGDAFEVTLHGDQRLPGADLGSEHS